MIAILITNPTGAHAIARAAHKSNVKPFGAVIDHLDKKSASKVKKKKEAKK